MKKASIFKKSLSAVLSVAVILSCMVFATPVPASAADGDYYVKVVVNVTDTA